MKEGRDEGGYGVRRAKKMMMGVDEDSYGEGGREMRVVMEEGGQGRERCYGEKGGGGGREEGGYGGRRGKMTDTRTDLLLLSITGSDRRAWSCTNIAGSD